MIPLESIRVSHCRSQTKPGDYLCVEWCVTGDIRLDPWCSVGKAFGDPTRPAAVRHVHHQAATHFISDRYFHATSHLSFGWSVALYDPFDPPPDPELDHTVSTGWLHPLYVKSHVKPGYHATLILPDNSDIRLEPVCSAFVLGCSTEIARFTDHTCLIREESAA